MNWPINKYIFTLLSTIMPAPVSNVKYSRSKRRERGETREERKSTNHDQQVLTATYEVASTRPIELTVSQFLDMYSKVCID